ncbi:hypothetical protein [Reichenbachiella sp. MSK19-1]|uniref:hypothetical protein n=1 Tax=Reichenbachiella sp. MSK19-1 TaxID=1897631 RepID=UPI000E6D5413|nr:hypothetical protein [Reichenbachiella sp. MSK19-1]RJE71992.1 hypothetical protein BGP76_07900 [Reichenbachiella sp. MSK19-1]
MSIRSNYNEQIEAYFNGEMQGADRLVFEGRVESDPMLKEEFVRQQEIVESLRAHRVAELKTRLNNISVETTLIGTLMQSAAFKPVVYAVTGLAVSVGAYLYLDTDAAIEYHLQGLESKNQYALETGLTVHTAPSLNYRYTHSENILPVAEEREIAKEELSKGDVPVATQEIRFEVPEVDAGYQQDEFEAGPVVALESAKRIEEVPSVSKIDRVNIQTINSRRYDFHYRMEENRLYLYGKFNESPYEIIEINTPGAKKLFFYYDGDFFTLNKESTEITPLSKIENRKLINELDVIKSSNL